MTKEKFLEEVYYLRGLLLKSGANEFSSLSYWDKFAFYGRFSAIPTTVTYAYGLAQGVKRLDEGVYFDVPLDIQFLYLSGGVREGNFDFNLLDFKILDTPHLPLSGDTLSDLQSLISFIETTDYEHTYLEDSDEMKAHWGLVADSFIHTYDLIKRDSSSVWGDYCVGSIVRSRDKSVYFSEFSSHLISSLKSILATRLGDYYSVSPNVGVFELYYILSEPNTTRGENGSFSLVLQVKTDKLTLTEMTVPSELLTLHCNQFKDAKFLLVSTYRKHLRYFLF